MKTNFSRNDSFINCWVCSVHPPRQVRSTSLAFWNTFCGYACSSPRRESVPVFCQISITFFAATKIVASIGVIHGILYWLHSEAAKNENVLEYSTMWLYQRRNVLIYYKRWWRRGHWQIKHFVFFFWGGGWREFEKWWVHIFPYSESLKTLYWSRSEILEH